MKKFVQTATEYLPIIVFFIIFKLYDITLATQAVVGVTILMLIVNYLINKTIPAMTIFSASLMIFFGGLTIITNDVKFLKIKPTIVNLAFGGILIGGLLLDKPLLKHLLGSKIKLNDESAWKKLSVRFAVFFIFLAVLNEVIWRNFSLETWVWFKVFGLMMLNFAFILTQIRFISRHMQK